MRVPITHIEEEQMVLYSLGSRAVARHPEPDFDSLPLSVVAIPFPPPAPFFRGSELPLAQASKEGQPGQEHLHLAPARCVIFRVCLGEHCMWLLSYARGERASRAQSMGLEVDCVECVGSCSQGSSLVWRCGVGRQWNENCNTDCGRHDRRGFSRGLGAQA